MQENDEEVEGLQRKICDSYEKEFKDLLLRIGETQILTDKHRWSVALAAAFRILIGFISAHPELREKLELGLEGLEDSTMNEALRKARNELH